MKHVLTFSFINCKTEKASASLRSSPNAFIRELRTTMLGFTPSAIMTLNAFIAWSDKPCTRIEERYTQKHSGNVILIEKIFQKHSKLLWCMDKDVPTGYDSIHRYIKDSIHGYVKY